MSRDLSQGLFVCFFFFSSVCVHVWGGQKTTLCSIPQPPCTFCWTRFLAGLEPNLSGCIIRLATSCLPHVLPLLKLKTFTTMGSRVLNPGPCASQQILYQLNYLPSLAHHLMECRQLKQELIRRRNKAFISLPPPSHCCRLSENPVVWCSFLLQKSMPEYIGGGGRG